MTNHEQAPSTSELQPQTEVSFVFAYHSPAEVPAIVEAIKATKPDIVALECVGGDIDERAVRQKQLSDAASDKEINLPWDVHPMYGAIARALKGTNVEFVFTDIDDAHPAMQSSEKASSSWTYYRQNEYAERGLGKIRKKHYLKKYLEHTAGSNIVREQLVASQIDDIAKSNQGRRITVLAGASHTAIQNMVDPYIQTGRVFVPRADAQLEKAEKIRFGEVNTAVRAVRFGKKTVKQATSDILGK